MKKKLISLSFKQVLLVVVPLLVVGLYTCISFSLVISSIITDSSTRYVNSQLEKVEKDVVSAFQPPALALNTLAASIERNSPGRNEIYGLIKGTAPQYPVCAAFYYSTATALPDGGYLCMSDDWEAPAGWTQTTRPWYTGAVEAQGELYASEPYENARFGTVCISFSRAVYSARNQLTGIVGCDIPLNALATAVSGIFISPNTNAYIIDQKGMYLTNPDSAAIMRRSYFDDSAIDTRKYNAASWLDGTPHGGREGNHFYTVRKLAATPWFIVMDGPLSDFTGRADMWFNIILIVMIALVVACVFLNAAVMNRTNAKEAKVSEQLIAETQNLVVAAKENAATSQDQSAAVKEIVATMEDNNTLSENISAKIKDVSGVATKTSGDVAEGVAYLEANVRQLHEISDANQKTIDGIKELGGKIENIWDIVTLINSVADQAKIIAFNAELEASSAGEAGKNFHIVATEIRRLADGIIDGTKEIKERINEIQQSSDQLILASESGTEKIKQGYDNAKSLEVRFESIKNASEITASSAGDITTIIQQQAMASEQILITLKQIAAGIENFTAATENISNASQSLKSIATDLSEKAAAQQAPQR